MEIAQTKLRKPILIGILGFTAMLAVYFTAVGLISDTAFAVSQFEKYWYYIIALMVPFFVFVNNKNRESVPQSGIQSSQTGSLLKEQKDEQGEIFIEVAPLSITADAETWDFKIILNTHSVPLDQDMTKISVLLDDKGNIYQPIQWDGAPLGGHHGEGILKFKPIIPKPEAITLKIKDIGGVKEKIFQWSLK